MWACESNDGPSSFRFMVIIANCQFLSASLSLSFLLVYKSTSAARLNVAMGKYIASINIWCVYAFVRNNRAAVAQTRERWYVQMRKHAEVKNPII